MHKFKEAWLHSIWMKRLMSTSKLVSVSGKEITVIRPGELNTDAGPDFSNALLMIDDVLLAGNVEIHVRTSDWIRHQHQNDPRYDRIILHVVYEHDRDLLQNQDYNVEVLELKNSVPPEVLLQRDGERHDNRVICYARLVSINSDSMRSWLEELVSRRLDQKVKRIRSYHELFRGDYRQTFYTLLLRNFGFSVNSTPFELLAKSLPLSLLMRHSDNLNSLEALLLGCAGLLDQQYEHSHILDLQNEYSFLKRKYGLISIDRSILKFSRMRPANFPALRLAQFAALIHRSAFILNAPQFLIRYEDIYEALQFKTSRYWQEHYSPDDPAGRNRTSLGRSAIENLMINTFVPFLYFYGLKRNSDALLSSALTLLERCGPENNFKTRAFSEKGLFNRNALCSQGLIELFDQYCRCKKCLTCKVGKELLSA